MRPHKLIGLDMGTSAVKGVLWDSASGDIRKFLAAYSRLGGTHHLTACYDADLETLAEWAHLMGWTFAVIE